MRSWSRLVGLALLASVVTLGIGILQLAGGHDVLGWTLIVWGGVLLVQNIRLRFRKPTCGRD